MNIRTATNEQLRDWLAIKQGWSPIYDLDGKASQWNRPLGSAYEVCFDHPTPNTIDAAVGCLPPGWKWACNLCDWIVYPPGPIDGNHVEFPRSCCPDSARDELLRLAAKAWMKMEESQ